MSHETTSLEPSASVLQDNAFKRYLLATRPKFFPASVLPVAAGTAWGAKVAGVFAIPEFLLALLATVLVHAASNVFNDVGDEIGGTDRSNSARIYPYTGGSRFIQNDILTLRQMTAWAVLLCLAAAILGGALTWMVGPGVIWFGVAGIALGMLYSLPGIQLSGRGVGELAVAIAFGIIPVTGAAWVQGAELNLPLLVFSLPISCWVAAILIMNEVPDIEADGQTGKRTLVVRLREKGARRLYLGTHAIALLAVAYGATTGYWPAWWVIAPAALFLLAVKGAGAVVVTPNRDALRKAIEATLAIHTMGSLWLLAVAVFSL